LIIIYSNIYLGHEKLIITQLENSSLDIHRHMYGGSQMSLIISGTLQKIDLKFSSQGLPFRELLIKYSNSDDASCILATIL
jgi:hypothetical protein